MSALITRSRERTEPIIQAGNSTHSAGQPYLLMEHSDCPITCVHSSTFRVCSETEHELQQSKDNGNLLLTRVRKANSTDVTVCVCVCVYQYTEIAFKICFRVSSTSSGKSKTAQRARDLRTRARAFGVDSVRSVGSVPGRVVRQASQ